MIEANRTPKAYRISLLEQWQTAPDSELVHEQRKLKHAYRIARELTSEAASKDSDPVELARSAYRVYRALWQDSPKFNIQIGHDALCEAWLHITARAFHPSAVYELAHRMLFDGYDGYTVYRGWCHGARSLPMIRNQLKAIIAGMDATLASPVALSLRANGECHTDYRNLILLRGMLGAYGWARLIEYRPLLQDRGFGALFKCIDKDAAAVVALPNQMVSRWGLDEARLPGNFDSTDYELAPVLARRMLKIFDRTPPYSWMPAKSGQSRHR